MMDTREAQPKTGKDDDAFWKQREQALLAAARRALADQRGKP